MKGSSIALLNSICETHKELFAFSQILLHRFPKQGIRFDLSMYSSDLKEYMGSPIGITSEINIDKPGDEAVFFFEWLFESKWIISAERAIPGHLLKTQDSFFIHEFEAVEDFIIEALKLVEKFKLKVLNILET